MRILESLATVFMFGCHVLPAFADESALLVPALVRIPGKNFEIGKFEVTQGEWKAVMGSNPSKFTACGDSCPVEQVSWYDIKAFLNMINARTGREYRLPTEAEWEYACSGGSQAEYCGGNDTGAVAWTDGNSSKQTHPVGQKQANGYGLHDMTGNVWEWTDECWDVQCEERVCRGGSWASLPQFAHLSFRSRSGSAVHDDDVGFRLARTLPE